EIENPQYPGAEARQRRLTLRRKRGETRRNPRSLSANPYESERLLAEYLLFHYGTAEEILPAGAPAGMREALDFAVRSTRHFPTGRVNRTLDLGCAAGRSTYELSRDSAHTLAIDFSASFIRAAAALSRGPVGYLRLD